LCRQRLHHRRSFRSESCQYPSETDHRRPPRSDWY